MFYFILYVIPIFITVAAAASNSKDITYDNPVNVIVKDLIENWESPFAYLKCRGYLKDVQSAPDLDDFQQQLQESSGQELPLYKDSKRELDQEENICDLGAARSSEGFKDSKRELDQEENKFNSGAARTSEGFKDSKRELDQEENKFDSGAARSSEGFKDSKRELDQEGNKCDSRGARSADFKDLELKQMFQKLFSSNNQSVSDELKSKLDVNWDMGALKFSARQSATKYLKEQEDIVAKAGKANGKTPSSNDNEPLVLEPLVKEAKMKELLFKDNMFEEELYKKTPVKDPFAIEPLIKKHMIKEQLLQEQPLNEPVAKDNPPFKNPDFLSGLAKILGGPEMRAKDKAANQENRKTQYIRW